MSNRTIISLGILKVNWDNFKKDYIENFVPLVAECIKNSEDDVVSLPSLQTQMRDQFGLDIPQHVLEAILKRVNKRKYTYLDHLAYRPNKKRLASLNFREVRDKVLRIHEEVIAYLIEFVHDKYSLNWTADDAETALLSFLEDNELLVVNTTKKGTTIPEIKYPIKSPKYLIGSFVRVLQNSHSELLNYFDTVVKGNMLANAIFLTDIYEPQRKFRKTAVYFDTPFLINALCFTGETRQAPCIELLNLLYETGAGLKCFRHTLEETIGALDAVCGQLSRGREQFTYGPGIATYEYFLSKGLKCSDFEILIGRIERDLNALRIEVVEKPEYSEEFIIDENELLEFIKQHVKYRRERAAEKDVDSISAIYRLRKWREYRLIEECNAVFVTSNRSLVKAIGEYFYKNANSSSVSPCLSDYSLTNLLWLKRPTSAPDLPKKRIIADCFAATQPSEDLWTKYLKEIDQLEKDKGISPDDYYYLRYSIEAKSALMDITLGDVDAFAQGTVKEILEVIKDRARADLVEKLKASEDKVKSLESEKQQTIRNIRIESEIRAKRIIKLLRYMVLFFLILVTILTAPWFNIWISLPLVYWGLWIILAVIAIITTQYGTSIESLLRKLEISLSKRYERKLLLLASINPDNNFKKDYE